MNDREFLAAFEGWTVRNGEFRHRDHIRMAWLYLNRDGWEKGFSQIKNSIHRFAAAYNVTTLYHETVTQFWARKVADAIHVSPKATSFDDFEAKHLYLLDKTLIAKFYSDDLLYSDTARKDWIMPDLQPISDPLLKDLDPQMEPTNDLIETNKAVVRRFFEEVMNKGDIAVLHELFSPQYGIGSDQGGVGPDRAKHTVEMLRTAFPDIHFTVDELIAEKNLVAVRVTLNGTHDGEFMGIAPTGRPITVAGVEFIHLQDGKILSGWHQYDSLGIMRQLGVVET